jgi:hypothetical protein
VSIKLARAGNNLWANITNSDHGLYDVKVYLYDSNAPLVQKDYQTSPSIPYPTPWSVHYNYANSTTGTWFAYIYMKYHKGTSWWSASTVVYWRPLSTGIVDMSDFENLMTQILGDSPVYIEGVGGAPDVVVPYGTLLVTCILIVFFFIFQAKFVGFAAFFMAVLSGLLRSMGLLTEAMMPDVSIAAIAIIGVILMMVKFKYSPFSENVDADDAVIFGKKTSKSDTRFIGPGTRAAFKKRDQMGDYFDKKERKR